MPFHKSELLVWIRKERDYMSALLLDFQSGRRKVGRIENGQMIDETQKEVDALKQRIDELSLFIADP